MLVYRFEESPQKIRAREGHPPPPSSASRGLSSLASIPFRIELISRYRPDRLRIVLSVDLWSLTRRRSELVRSVESLGTKPETSESAVRVGSLVTEPETRRGGGVGGGLPPWTRIFCGDSRSQKPQSRGRPGVATRNAIQRGPGREAPTGAAAPGHRHQPFHAIERQALRDSMNS